MIAEALDVTPSRIEHVGSTSVPGLAAKPTIDIAVGVGSTGLSPSQVERMAAAGFAPLPDDERPWEVRFVRGDEVPREVIVHVVEWQGAKWNEFLRFREALRADRALAAEYEQLKRTLLERGRWYRGVDKSELIEAVLRRVEEHESASPEETEQNRRGPRVGARAGRRRHRLRRPGVGQDDVRPRGLPGARCRGARDEPHLHDRPSVPWGRRCVSPRPVPVPERLAGGVGRSRAVLRRSRVLRRVARGRRGRVAGASIPRAASPRRRRPKDDRDRTC